MKNPNNWRSRFVALAGILGNLCLLVSHQESLASCVPPPSGLVGWWPAEGNTIDVQGTNNGVFTNLAYAVGEVGRAFSFAGSGSYVQIPDNPALSLTNEFTVELWYEDTGVPAGAYAGLVAKRPYSGPCNFGLSILGGSSGGFLVYFLDPNYGSYQGSTYSPLPPAGGWHHLATSYRQVTAEQIELKQFIDGQLVKTATLPGNLSRTVNNSPIYFGCSNPTGGEFFKGNIDEISIYNRALLASEIAAIYNAGSSGKCAPPARPSIFSQPTNQTVLAGSTVYLSVGATGTQPLSYQWSVNGKDLAGATDALLALTNVQVSQSGTYAVQVTNSLGAVVSSKAVLTVNPPPPCVAPPAGLVSWWPGEGNANDNEGVNNGVFNNPSYGSGEVGLGFSFDGTGNNVRVPASASLNVGAGSGLTIEAWINPSDTASRPIVEWVSSTVGNLAAHFYVNQGGPGALYANLYDTANNYRIIQSAQGLVLTNVFQHVAVTYDKPSGTARLYVNGALAKESVLGTFTPQTSPDLSIGYRPNTVPFGPVSFIGRIDEVSLYSRALSPSEIQAIYNAGSSGKCNIPIPANILSQPASQIVTVGQTAMFQVGAGGTAPLSYLWSFNGTSLPGATNASLVLTNVQMSQAGSYAVVVTNAYASATSSNATLVVNFPPAAVNVVNTSGTAGQSVTVPVALAANGNENAIGFSLNFSPTLLTNLGVTLGTGATGASLQFNTNQPGAVGVIVALPSGGTFAPGTQQVVQVSFVAAVSNTAYLATLSFGDQPTKRELSDVGAHTLAANFIGGQVSLARAAFEADVAPRPNGDGALTTIDWVQVGRFVAALDSPTNASEFQRADCAPRSTLGDGLLTVSDWVQAGRYVAGLDPLTVAGGPTGPLGGPLVAPKTHRLGNDPARVLNVQGPVVFQGQNGTANVNLEAQGDENGIGFSLAFDPTVVTYASASLGPDAASATMDINANQATNGRLGIILALPTDVSFSPGTRQVVKVNFQAVTAASVTSTVALTDLPVHRDVADTNAIPLVSTYVGGTISVNPRPTLAIAHSNQNINLSWPLWATNYILQEALGSTLPISAWTNLSVSPSVTNGATTVTQPLSGSIRFYRLRHQ